MPLGANKAAIMGAAGVSTADVVLLYDTDHSNVASAAITSDITSTYGEYIFRFYNINPASDTYEFTFQCSIDGGSNYNVTVTTTAFNSYHQEDDGETSLGYKTGWDQAQGSSYQQIMQDMGNGSDESGNGELHLFDPASTTYVKHFYSRASHYHKDNAAVDDNFSGYFNTTSAINAISFKMSSGNFDGTIKMWGVK